jgi:hypothetical protein
VTSEYIHSDLDYKLFLISEMQKHHM